jgi:hypothetical protein
MNVEYYISRPSVQRRIQLLEADFSAIQSSIMRGYLLNRTSEGVWTVPAGSSSTIQKNDGDWIMVLTSGMVSMNPDLSFVQQVDVSNPTYVTASE